MLGLWAKGVARRFGVLDLTILRLRGLLFRGRGWILLQLFLGTYVTTLFSVRLQGQVGNDLGKGFLEAQPENRGPREAGRCREGVA